MFRFLVQALKGPKTKSETFRENVINSEVFTKYMSNKSIRELTKHKELQPQTLESRL